MKKYLVIFLTVLVSAFLNPAYGRGSKSSSSSSKSSRSSSVSTHKSEKTVHVQEYKKKNGTVVHSYDRRPPGTGSDKEKSK